MSTSGAKWHPLHCDPEDDIIFKSNDGTLFRSSSKDLAKLSGLFRDMMTLAKPQSPRPVTPTSGSGGDTILPDFDLTQSTEVVAFFLGCIKWIGHPEQDTIMTSQDLVHVFPDEDHIPFRYRGSSEALLSAEQFFDLLDLGDQLDVCRPSVEYHTGDYAPEPFNIFVQILDNTLHRKLENEPWLVLIQASKRNDLGLATICMAHLEFYADDNLWNLVKDIRVAWRYAIIRTLLGDRVTGEYPLYGRACSSCGYGRSPALWYQLFGVQEKIDVDDTAAELARMFRTLVETGEERSWEGRPGNGLYTVIKGQYATKASSKRRGPTKRRGRR